MTLETPKEFDGTGALNFASRALRGLHVDGPLLSALGDLAG